MTETQHNFLGIPITGKLNFSSRQEVAQRTQEEIAPIIQAVLDDPTVIEFGWRQYTPYFNDGDPCEFSAYGAWVRLTSDEVPDEEDVDSYDAQEYLEIAYAAERLGKRPSTWVGQWPSRGEVYGPYVGPDEARYDRLMALHDAIDNNEFNDVLLRLFGDHASITVKRTGITVDFYSHD